MAADTPPLAPDLTRAIGDLAAIIRRERADALEQTADDIDARGDIDQAAGPTLDKYLRNRVKRTADGDLRHSHQSAGYVTAEELAEVIHTAVSESTATIRAQLAETAAVGIDLGADYLNGMESALSQLEQNIAFRTAPSPSDIAKTIMAADASTIGYERRWPETEDLDAETWTAYLAHAEALITAFDVRTRN